MKLWMPQQSAWQPWPRNDNNRLRIVHHLRVLHQLRRVKDVKHLSIATNCSSGERDSGSEQFLRLGYLTGRPHSWENRGNQLHLNSQNFRSKSTKACWLDRWKTPVWVVAALERDPLIVNAARGSCGIAAGPENDCRPDMARRIRKFHLRESGPFLISQYVKRGQAKQALKMYDEMLRCGLKLNPHTLVALLKACGALQDFEYARRIHGEILESGLEFNLYIGTLLVQVYVKCGNMVEARCAFEKLSHRDVGCWNTMLMGYAQMSKGVEALDLYAQMQKAAIIPDRRTYVSVLKACGSLARLQARTESDGVRRNVRCLEAVRAIHSELRKRQLDSDLFVGNVLLDAYAKCGQLEDARRVFEKMPFHDVVSWNAMIFSHAQWNDGKGSLQLFIRMKQEGVTPDGRTYVGVLKACSTLAERERNDGDTNASRDICLETVRHIHSDVIRRKMEADMFVGTMLVDVYSRCGNMENARLVFEKIARRDVVSWTAMILGYAATDQGEEALELFAKMESHGVVPDARTYVGVLKACSSLTESKERSLTQTVACRKRCLDMVSRIRGKLVAQRFETDVFVATMLVDVYAKCGSMEDAFGVFKSMPHRDVVSWNALLSGYTLTGEGHRALQVFEEMQLEGAVPDDQTYVSALKACGSLGQLDKGKEIHAQITTRGSRPMHLSVASSLIDMYAKCGSMVDAQRVFDASPTKDVVAWSALITGYSQQGDSDHVFALLQRMQHEGIQPDDTTFLGVLLVCNHRGLVESGQTYFEAMRRDYGITPTTKHLTCMVDLLGRAGLLAEAMEMVKNIPFPPPSALWISVLNACRMWTAVALGRQAFESAVKADRKEAAAYVLMSNIYADIGMQEKAEEIQAMRLKSEAWKEPGRSWCVDTSGCDHVFVASDYAHPESPQMHMQT